MSFLEACEMIYEGIIRGGHPGIIAAGDADSAWVFSSAPEKKGVVEYGLPTYFVDKTTGQIRCFSPVENEDWEIMDKAKEIEVPERFRPRYN